MSLLMDALKRAEEAKRAAGEVRGTEPQATRELELAPLEAMKADTPTFSSADPAQSGTSALPELSQHIESVDADLVAVSTGTRKPRSTKGNAPTHSPAPHAAGALPRDDSERATVRNAFAAKQASEPRSALWVILPVSAVVAIGMGTYFWWQLQAISSGSLAQPGAMTIAPADHKPPPAAPVAAKPSDQPAVPPMVESQPTNAANSVPQHPPATATARNNASVKPTASIDRDPARQTPKKPVSATASPSSDNSLHLTRTQPKPNLTLEQAYDALQAGQMDMAQRAYQQVLRNDPKSTDALLGLATIAAHQGDTARAHSYYLLALESNPNDATAQAGVVQTRGQSDPAQSESRLKTALSSQPDSPALLFALGNLYAREQRWGEAQQAYFRAYSTEPDNADFIFNLAVSLDQLHQSRLAAQYYRMALNAAEASSGSQAVGFDRDLVQNRIQDLLR